MAYTPRWVRKSRPAIEDDLSEGSDDSPLSGILTRSIAELLEEWVRSKLESGQITNQQVDELIERTMAETMEPAADTIHESLRHNLPGLVRSLREGEQRIQKYLDHVWGGPDRRYQAAAYLSYELGSSISRASHGIRTSVLLGLHARACRTSAEIRLLAMNGFAAGAEARWRSMHELSVTAALIAANDDELAGRYLAHADIELWRDMETFQTHAERLRQVPFDDGEVAEARQRFESVVAEFGGDIKRENGWAAPLFAPGQRITFRELEALADLGHWRPYYRMGSHHVHAGARAAELNMVHLPDGSRTTPGATVYADIAETCHAALLSLMLITAQVVTHHVGENDDQIVDVMIGLLCMQRLVDDAGDLYESAARRATERGLTGHSPRREMTLE